jgi:hypothetical protein
MGRLQHKSWKQLYEAAVLELNEQALPHRILEVQRAVEKRAWVMAGENADDTAERDALANAAAVLEDLKRMYLPGGKQQ